MNQLRALLEKEFKEAFRDKRAFMAAMMMAFLAPVMIYAVSTFAIKEAVKKPDVFVDLVGAEYAPNLIQALNQENIFSIEEANESDKQNWSQRLITIEIPDSFAESMNEGKVIDIIVRADMSEDSINTPLRRINDTINGFSREIGVKRILMRGIDINLLTPLSIVEQDTAPASNNAEFINQLLIFYMLFGAFITGLSVAVDTSAGERERNVLEFLLSQPVATAKIVGAKLASSSFVAIIGVVLTLVLTAFAVGFIDLSQVGASFNLDIYTVVIMMTLLIPICLLASSIQLLLAFQAKSFKEAQSTVSMVIIIPAFIPFALSFMDNKPEWLDYMPISGQYLLMEEVMKGVPVSLAMVCLVSAVTLIITGAVFSIIAKKLESEKTVLALS